LQTTVSQCKVEELIAFNVAITAPVGTNIAAEMGGKTFAPGTYHATTLSTAAADIVTLNGGPNDVFIL
jgi:hypothetical protein